MTHDEARKLLGGFATGNLTAAERKALFEAALHDAELFEDLADEQVLKETLEDASCRGELLASLNETTSALQSAADYSEARRIEHSPLPASPAPPPPKKRVWWPVPAVMAVCALLAIGIVSLIQEQAREKPQQVAVQKRPQRPAPPQAKPPAIRAPRVAETPVPATPERPEPQRQLENSAAAIPRPGAVAPVPGLADSATPEPPKQRQLEKSTAEIARPGAVPGPAAPAVVTGKREQEVSAPLAYTLFRQSEPGIWIRTADSAVFALSDKLKLELRAAEYGSVSVVDTIAKNVVYRGILQPQNPVEVPLPAPHDLRIVFRPGPPQASLVLRSAPGTYQSEARSKRTERSAADQAPVETVIEIRLKTSGSSR